MATELRTHSWAGRLAFPLTAAATLVVLGTFFIQSNSYVVGGSDDSGYHNHAKALARGELRVPVRETAELGLPETDVAPFVPLGYAPAPVAGRLAPMYPPGLPLLQAAAGAVGGWGLAPFLVVPLISVLCVPAVYLLGREFGLPPWEAWGGGLILALSPVFQFMAVGQMSDCVATFWCTVTVWLALSSRRRAGWAVLAGAVFGMATLTRPTNALLLPAVALALPLTRRHWAGLLAGGTPAGLFFLWHNHYSFGHPFGSGYGNVSVLLKWSNGPARAEHYGWQALTQFTPVVIGGWLAAVALPVLPARRRLFLAAWPAAIAGFYVFYECYETWWYFRFLLPGVPPLIVGALVAVRRGAERAWPARPRLAGVACLAVIAVIMVGQWKYFGKKHFMRFGALHGDQTACWVAAVNDHAGADGYMICMHYSGSVKYYTDLRIVRYNSAQVADVSRRLVERGKRVFAVLIAYEVPTAQERMPGEWKKIAEHRDVSVWEVHLTPPNMR